MNQPATKEPTMDEILSSIRQIIADDDAAAAQRLQAQRQPASPRLPEPTRRPTFSADLNAQREPAPLSLKPEQIVRQDTRSQQAPSLSSAHLQAALERDLSVPPAPQPVMETYRRAVEAPTHKQVLTTQAQPARVDAYIPQPEPKPQMQVEVRSAPVVQPAAVAQDTASNDPVEQIVEELIEPATSSAVRETMSKLNAPKISPELALSGITLDAMVREMIRPMLKDWLDENLPSMVERIVTAEIERVSRGQ